MYKISINNLAIKFINYNDYTSYLILFKYLNHSIQFNSFKKKIYLNIDNWIILKEINEISKLYNCCITFDKIIKNCGLYISNININNILILYNKKINTYIILGLNISKNTSNINMIDIFKYNYNININGSIKLLNLLFFIPNINNDVYNKLSEDIYKYNLNIVTQDSNFECLPIVNMNNDNNKYLSNVLKFIYLNIEEILNIDYIIISNNEYSNELFNSSYLSQIKNYDILGEKQDITISENQKIREVVENLFSNDKMKIKNIDLSRIYKNYKYIILNTQFIKYNIDKLIYKDIQEISIICNYYDKF
jgi:hypothetical protein